MNSNTPAPSVSIPTAVAGFELSFEEAIDRHDELKNLKPSVAVLSPDSFAFASCPDTQVNFALNRLRQAIEAQRPRYNKAYGCRGYTEWGLCFYTWLYQHEPASCFGAMRRLGDVIRQKHTDRLTDLTEKEKRNDEFVVAEFQRFRWNILGDDLSLIDDALPSTPLKRQTIEQIKDETEAIGDLIAIETKPPPYTPTANSWKKAKCYKLREALDGTYLLIDEWISRFSPGGGKIKKGNPYRLGRRIWRCADKDAVKAKVVGWRRWDSLEEWEQVFLFKCGITE